MKTKVFLIIMALAVLSFSSCKKNNTYSPIEPVSAELVDDDAVTEVVFDDVFNTVDNATIIMENLMGL
jgi:hypothetical protein